jgi:hypothetical protein
LAIVPVFQSENGWPLESMQVFVRTLNNTTTTVDVEGSDTVEVVKQKIATKLGNIQAADIDLSFGGKIMSDKQPIENYNVQKSCTIQMIARLKGGMTW